jgi:S-DNA-T family DNA segregation ATPase FtsK/SpoIIIE
MIMKKRTFVIPQLSLDEEEKAKEENVKPTTYKSEPFVSSVFGTKVKDEITFSGAQFGNQGRQYDAFRDRDKRIIQDDYKAYVTIKNEDLSIKKESPAPKIISNSIPVNPNPTPVREQEVRIVEEYGQINTYDDEDTENIRGSEPEVVEFSRVEERPQPQPEVVPPVKKIIRQPEPVAPTKPAPSKKGKYVAPPLSLLKRGKPVRQGDVSAVLYQRERIDTTLKEFNIPGQVVNYTKGPAVTQFEVQLEPGVKVQKVKTISNNLMASLKAKSIRIQAPIPGKSTVGIEVPNAVTDYVFFGELLQDPEFLNDGNPMNVVLGLDLSGKPVYLNITKMPHCLIGGTTGSGKSVCINSMIVSILYKAHPDDVKLILIDPKIIEFSNYEDIPHLATPVITEPKVATAALKWAVEEMQNRYQLFRSYRVREYEEYAKLAANDINVKPIPYIVIVIDELADLMLVSGNDVEDYIQRLTQKGRASGIHLIVATQRPSVDVIKGTIKTNIPTRIAFMVKTQIDSSIILDHSGAEKLLGHGDMLYNDSVSEQRLQGAYISSEEIKAVTNYIREKADAEFMFTQEDLEAKMETNEYNDGISDEFFPIVARFVVENNSASINRIQKTFGIGFNRAQAIMQGLEELGIVSENLGSRARTVEVNLEQLEGILEEI